MIPLNFTIPSNLTNITFVNTNITIRNNGVTVTNIGLYDTTKVDNIIITVSPAVGVIVRIILTADFVNANFGSMQNNSPVSVRFQSASSGLVFTDPNAQPDVPDVPDDEGEDPVDADSQSNT